MLAAHDQENLVSIHQAAANTKQQQQQTQATNRTLHPKTPGTRYPKTPLKIPLNDENAARGLGGKSIVGNKTKGDKSQWVTPAGPRTARAVLGDKTTNAKAQTQQSVNGKAPAVREIEKSQVRPTTISRPNPIVPKADSSKLQILLDSTDPLSDEVDTNPEPPRELPYESDVFPAGVLTYEGIKPENRTKGYFDSYHNARDENGMTRLDREMKARQEKRFKEADAKIRKDLEEMTWDLGLDSPKKKKSAAAPEPVNKKIVRPGATTRAPSTLTSRRAVSALGMASRPASTDLQRKPLATKLATSTNASKLPSFMQPTRSKPATTKPKVPSTATTSAGLALAASRNTLGYTKGRNASSAIHGHARSKSEAPSRVPARTASTASASSNATITPASYAEGHAEGHATPLPLPMPKPEFVCIFNTAKDDDDEDDSGLGVAADDVDLLRIEDEEDEFQLDLDF